MAGSNSHSNSYAGLSSGRMRAGRGAYHSGLLIHDQSQGLQGIAPGTAFQRQPSFRVLSDTRFQGAPSTLKSFAYPLLHLLPGLPPITRLGLHQ